MNNRLIENPETKPQDPIPQIDQTGRLQKPLLSEPDKDIIEALRVLRFV